MGTQRAILVLLVGIMWLGLLAGADAQGTGNIERGVLVSPARLVATVESGDRLAPLKVKNTTDSQVEIVCYVGRGEHRWNGSPIYLDSPVEREWGARYLELDKTELVLGPGESDTVTATLKDLSGVQGGLYPVIFFELQPSGKREGAVAVSRLAVLTLLQVAGSTPSDLFVSTVDIQQASCGEAIGVFPLVTNQGGVHANISGYIEIANSAGDVSTRLSVQPMTVLPGCSRQLALWWHPERLPTGTYQVNAHLSAGRSSIEAGQWAFRVAQPYQLASIQGDVVSWYPDLAHAAQTIPFAAVIHNSGTDAWQAMGELLVMNTVGDVEARVSVEIGEIQPGGSGRVAGLIPPLDPGRYTLKMSLMSEGIPLLDAEHSLDVMVGDTIAQR